MGSLRAVLLIGSVPFVAIVGVAACSAFGEANGSSSGGDSSPTPSIDGSTTSTDDASSSSEAGGEGGDAGDPVPVVEAGCGERALRFNGLAASYAEIQDHTSVDLNNDFTVEAWIKPSVANGEGHIVSHHHHGNGDGWVLLVKAGKAEVRIYGDESNGTPSSRTAGSGVASAYVDDNQWAHVAGVMRSNQLSLYWNGNRMGSDVGLNGLVRKPFSGNAKIGRAAELLNMFPFNGLIDELRISSVARYASNFAPPRTRFQAVGDTVALYHLDEADGSKVLVDAMGQRNATVPGPATVFFENAPCLIDR